MLESLFNKVANIAERNSMKNSCSWKVAVSLIDNLKGLLWKEILEPIVKTYEVLLSSFIFGRVAKKQPPEVF